jgi:hypothetical protein
MNLSSDEFLMMQKELDQKTTDLETILGYSIDYGRLSDKIAAAIQNQFGIRFETGNFLINQSLQLLNQ